MAQGRRTRLSSSAYKQARIVQQVSMPGLGPAWGTQWTCGLGRWGASRVRAGATRGSSLPAGRGRPRSSFRGLLPGAQLTCSAELGSTPGDGLSPVQSCPACHGPSRPNASGRLTSRNGRRATGNPRLPLKSLGFVLQPAASHRGSNAGPRVQQDASGSSVFIGIPFAPVLGDRSPSLTKGPREVSPSRSLGLRSGLASPCQRSAQRAQG